MREGWKREKNNINGTLLFLGHCVPEEEGERQNEKNKASNCEYDGWNLMYAECVTAALHIC